MTAAFVVNIETDDGAPYNQEDTVNDIIAALENFGIPVVSVNPWDRQLPTPNPLGTVPER